MINMLKISKHGIEPITTHMDLMAPSQEIQAMNQMLADRRPIAIRVAADLIIVLHLPRHSFVVVVDKWFAVVESCELVREVSRAFLVKPAAGKRVIRATAGLGFGRRVPA
jgi:hypothetical protein